MSRRRYNGRGWTWRKPKDVMTDDLKAKLNAAFACFRALGFVARQNFSCCSGCAGYELADRVGKKVTADERYRSKVRGCVFYHRQDAEHLRESGEVHLRYGQLDCSGVGPVGIETVEVGRQVTEVLVALGIPYEWDGSPDSTIVAKLNLVGAPMALARVG